MDIQEPATNCCAHGVEPEVSIECQEFQMYVSDSGCLYMECAAQT